MKLREELAQWQKRASDAETETKKLREDLTALQDKLAKISDQLADNPTDKEAKALRTELETVKAELRSTMEKLATLTTPPANPPKSGDKDDPDLPKPKEPPAPQTRKRPVPFV